jgi:hypothetical protein
MASKRVTPPEEIERLAERIHSEFKDKIDDKETFNQAFEDYLEVTLTPKQKTTLRQKTFSEYAKLEPDVRRVVKKRKKRVVRRKVPVKEFEIIGKQKGRIVFARKITIKVRGKSQTRYIDKRGRYVSIKKSRKK